MTFFAYFGLGCLALFLISGMVAGVAQIINKKNELKRMSIKQGIIFNEYKSKVDLMFDKILEEKTLGFPWLASAIADYYENYDKIFAEYLET